MLYIFDMGGVVTTTAGNVLYENIAKYIGISSSKFLSICKDNGDLLKQLDVGAITTKEFWILFSKITGIKVSADYFRILFKPERISETYSIIDELKQKGNRVVCGTNTIDAHYDNHICRGDYFIFDMTYTSIHLGVSKPDLRFWKMIMDIEGVEPENTFFTDDSEINVQAAASIGIKTHHFSSAGGLRKALNLL